MGGDVGGAGEAGGLDEEALGRGAVGEFDRADAERRRNRRDEAAEGRRREARQTSTSICAPLPSSTRSRPGLGTVWPASA